MSASRPRQAELLAECAHGDDACTLRLHLPPGLAHFAGHFPGAPVLPGVVQVQWALALAAPRMGLAARCRSMDALKFQRPMRPGDTVELALRFDRARGCLHFAYRRDGEPCASGRLQVEAA